MKSSGYFMISLVLAASSLSATYANPIPKARYVYTSSAAAQASPFSAAIKDSVLRHVTSVGTYLTPCNIVGILLITALLAWGGYKVFHYISRLWVVEHARQLPEKAGKEDSDPWLGCQPEQELSPSGKHPQEGLI